MRRADRIALGAIALLPAIWAGALLAAFIDPTGFGGVRETDGLEGLALFLAIPLIGAAMLGICVYVAVERHQFAKRTASLRPPPGWQPEPLQPPWWVALLFIALHGFVVTAVTVICVHL